MMRIGSYEYTNSLRKRTPPRALLQSERVV